MTVKFKEMSRRAKLILHVTGVLAFFNFFAFWCAALYLGGDAVNGYVRDLHYFICAHGSCHEVAHSIWKYSYWHAISALSGIALIFIEIAILINSGDVVID
ncbi:hypothetical protein WR30_14265 [Burkholderia contaminans FFH2055]|uniref:hypothetical protein n=1 Tax=Burkholderia contaminans TaxID=488447 RepID=UPI000625EDC8|nr:hypothetical protein [Burkholderia contaminans]KKL39152.1 hypothetical protein WR30_14265 [Burkholderia contaminans FFH2055]MEB4632699.1 hypothetical protein [Burkholderia contaminans]MEB4638875.1 hypothetical protein [Burkholderia contaminans]MEB4653531.1 hypothetical protein [Burkholderia contaminans]MEB4662265.1 hypothetical protein [Burkholderia contaminans]